MTKYIIERNSKEYEIVIGCEIHAQISTESKLFSRSPTKFGSTQNSQTSFIDAAMPGMLPMMNEYAVRCIVKTGLGIDAKINLKSIFDRKNYFYADLPQGYQISQFSDPIIGEGNIDITLENGDKKSIGIERIHLEQDAGKSIHDQHPSLSFIDLNRSGVPLMEIVSKPDMSSPFEASEYVKKIQSILRALNTSDADMEKGNLRCDANVSVREIGDKNLGTRCEIKNLNSTRNIIKAIIFESNRQVDIIEDGGSIHQETRLFNAVSGETRMMRSKEDSMDYRYFPDPDLPPLVISQDLIDDIKSNMPELPDQKKQRYILEYGISDYDAGILVSDIEISNYFEKLIIKNSPKLAISWLTVELLGRINKININFSDLKFSLDDFSDLLGFITDGTISGKIAKEILNDMMENGKNPKEIIEKKGLKQVSDIGKIEKVIDKIISINQDKVSEYKSGKEKLFGFFVGQVMREMKGKANPKIVNETLTKKLK